MNKFVKWLLILVGVVVGSCVTYCLVLMAGFYYVFGPGYSKTDLIDNYGKNKEKLVALSRYINAIVPAGKEVAIEFKGRRSIPIFHVRTPGATASNWDVAWNSPKADTLLRQLGWTHETLTILKDKLDEADCISVSNGEPCTIGYQRSGMGEYSYKLFAKSLPDSLRQKYNDGCTYIYYRDNVVLEYGGGAIGSQCFEGFTSGH